MVSVTLVASMAILVPVTALGGLQAMPPLAALATAMLVGSSLVLIAVRPSLGDIEWDGVSGCSRWARL